MLLGQAMWKTVLTVTLVLFFSNTYLHNFLADTVWLSHRVCLDRFQTTGITAHFYRTVVCAERSENGFGKNRPANAVVILMVSSLQIVWLEILLSLYIRRQSLAGSIVIPLVIVFYAFATGLRPVVVRAVAQLLVERTSRREKWGWPPLYCTTVASLLTLMMFPNFVLAAGFLISWIAATWARIVAKWPHRYWFLLLFIYPVFFGFPFSHSLSLGALIGWLIRPLLLGILIPPSFLVFVFPILHRVVDPIWQIYNWTISALARNFGPVALSLHSSLLFLWSYLLISLAFGLWITHYQRRSEIWSDIVPCEFF